MAWVAWAGGGKTLNGHSEHGEAHHESEARRDRRGLSIVVLHVGLLSFPICGLLLTGVVYLCVGAVIARGNAARKAKADLGNL